MAAQVTVVCGPAGSGKSETVLARYRAALAQSPPGATLWLAPHRRSAEHVRQQLLSGDLRACFTSGVATFAQFAEAVLAASGQTMRSISGLQKRRLLARVIQAAGERGLLKHFQPIAQTEGLLDLVSSFISELKRLEIWPDKFEAACRAAGASDKDRELGHIYVEYQALLNGAQLYDAEGRFWLAREVLKNGETRSVADVKLVVADGFSDFTYTQHEILQILAERVAEIWVTLPLEAATERSDLFAKPLTTLAELRKWHPLARLEARGLRLEVGRERPEGSSFSPTSSLKPQVSSLLHLERELFGNPRRARTAATTAGIEILAASGAQAEIELIAGRIKELLVRGLPDGSGPVRPGEIAVVFRSPEEAAPLIREVFAERGIPVAPEVCPKLGEAPALAALVRLLRLAAEDWPFRRLLAVVGSNYFQPDWPPWKAHGAAAAVEKSIRARQVPRGRATLLAGLARWAAEETPAGAEPDRTRAIERRRGLAQLALPVLERLGAALDRLPSKAACGQWSVALTALAQETGLLRAAGESLPVGANRDLPSWERLQDSLLSLNRLAAWLGEPAPLLNLNQLLDQLDEILRHEQAPALHQEAGRVRVLAAASARGLEIPHLFLAGLAEKSFPLAVGDHRMYSEAECQRLNAHGLRLSGRDQRSQDEMLLFYEVVTRATRRLTLSYPALDEAAQPLSPSPYLTEIERACVRPIQRTPALDLSPVPQHAEPLSPLEQRVKAVAEALQGNVSLLAGLVAAPARPGLAESTLSGLLVTHERSHGRNLGSYEGVLAGDAAAARLAAMFGPDRCWSASQLEQYASCPFKFFLERVLRLAPVEELALEVDYLTRGRRLHEALASFHRGLNDVVGRPAAPSALESAEIDRIYNGALAKLLEGVASDDPLQQALREIDRRLLVEWGASYVDQHSAYDGFWTDCEAPLRPAHFEVSFGSTLSGAVDPLSTEAPFELKHAGETIRLAGRIDRIDVGRVADRAVFNILDYKTGISQRLKLKEIEAGLALQLPLYAIVAQELLLQGDNAAPWRAGYWHIRGDGFKEKQAVGMSQRAAGGADEGVEPTLAWQKLRPAILDRLVSIVRGIRAAQFPVYSADEHCTGKCPFNTVCRVSQVRSLEKEWQAPPSNPC